MIIIRINNKHNKIYKHNSNAIRFNAILIPSSCMCYSCMLRVRGCVFCLFLFCLYICVCVYLQIHCPLRECRSIRPGASGLPYYYALLVCVPAVLGLLAVWRHNKPKTNNQQTNSNSHGWHMVNTNNATSKSKINLPLSTCVVFYFSFVCICVCACVLQNKFNFFSCVLWEYLWSRRFQASLLLHLHLCAFLMQWAC